MSFLESETALHADVPLGGTGHLAVDYGRFHSHAEVGGDVEVG